MVDKTMVAAALGAALCSCAGGLDPEPPVGEFRLGRGGAWELSEGEQRDPHVTWTGSEYLAVWTDSPRLARRCTDGDDRTGIARLAADGRWISSAVVDVCGRPSVASNGDVHLVAAYADTQLRLVRLRADGAAIDDPALVLSISPVRESVYGRPAIVVDGTDFVIGVGQAGVVSLVRVPANGPAPEPEVVSVDLGLEGPREGVALARDDTGRILAAWQASWPDLVPRGARVMRFARDLSRLDAEPRALGPCFGEPALAWHPAAHRFVAAWAAPNAAGSLSLEARSITGDGAITGASVGWPDAGPPVYVAPLGTELLITAMRYDDTTDSGARAVTFAAARDLGDARSLGAPAEGLPGGLASRGRGAMLVVAETTLAGGDVTGYALPSGARTRVSHGVARQWAPHVTAAPTGFVAAWREARDADEEASLVLWRFDARGLALDADPLSEGAEWSSETVIGSNGASTLAVWESGGAFSPAPGAAGVPVDVALGGAREPDAVVPRDDGSYLVLAHGGMALVGADGSVASSWRTVHAPEPTGVRVCAKAAAAAAGDRAVIACIIGGCYTGCTEHLVEVAFLEPDLAVPSWRTVYRFEGTNWDLRHTQVEVAAIAGGAAVAVRDGEILRIHLLDAAGLEHGSPVELPSSPDRSPVRLVEVGERLLVLVTAFGRIDAVWIDPVARVASPPVALAMTDGTPSVAALGDVAMVVYPRIDATTRTTAVHGQILRP